MKSGTPTVSIGLPVYNGENYLRSALESLIRQDYDDFELIISDNASTDLTGEICQAYARKDSRIRYVRNETNLGAAWNWNRVYELGRGKYFKWAAHDDECYPSNLRRCVETLDKASSSVLLVHPRAEVIDSLGAVQGTVPDRLDVRMAKPHQRLAKLLYYFSLGVAEYGLWRTEQLRKLRPNGCLAADRIRLAEVAMWGEIWEIPEVLLRIRIHPQNALSLNKTRQQIQAWYDPRLKDRAAILPYEMAVIIEHWKSVKHVQMSASQKSLCFVLPVIIPPFRWCLRWKGWLMEGLRGVHH